MTRWLKHNWRLKLVSLFLAALVWFFVNEITNDRRLVQAVPLEVNTAPGVTVLHQDPLMVDVLVRGTREDMRQVSRDDLTVVLDLSGTGGSDESSHRVGPRSVRHPRWAQPVDVSPSRVTVVIDEIIQQQIAVAPRFTSEPAKGYEVVAVQVAPETVQVAGPKLRVQDLASIPTLPINLKGRKFSFHLRTELNPDGLADLSLQQRYVEVDVRIAEVNQDKEGE